MNYLIDTHVLIWYLDGDKRISRKALDIITDPNHKINISIVSFWEMAVKLSIKKLQLSQPLSKIIDKTRSLQIEIIPLQEGPVLEVEKLPFHHRDPFDRLIIAQALVEKMKVVSIDESFDKYNVHRIW